MSFSLQTILFLKKLVKDRINDVHDKPEEFEKEVLKLCEKELAEIDVVNDKKIPLLYSRRLFR
jgi:hypothetical protein